MAQKKSSHRTAEEKAATQAKRDARRTRTERAREQAEDSARPSRAGTVTRIGIGSACIALIVGGTSSCQPGIRKPDTAPAGSTGQLRPALARHAPKEIVSQDFLARSGPLELTGRDPL